VQSLTANPTAIKPLIFDHENREIARKGIHSASPNRPRISAQVVGLEGGSLAVMTQLDYSTFQRMRSRACATIGEPTRQYRRWLMRQQPSVQFGGADLGTRP